MLKTLLSLTLTLITWNLKIVNSVDCSTGTTSTSCAAISGCTWQSGTCACASSVAMDICFALDASGSIGSSAFQTELTWLEGVIQNGLAQTARLDFIRFASTVDVLLTFPVAATYTTAQLVTFVSKITYTGGSTDTTGAIEAAEAQFNLYSSNNRSKVLIIITDGNPNAPDGNNNVCQYASTLQAMNIEVVLIGVGSSWTPALMDCLVTSDSDIIPVTSFSQSSFNAILPQLTAITCPVTYNLVITEIHPVPITPGTNGNGSRFIEIYNPGTQVTLSYLQLTGLFTGTLTTNNNIVLKQGQYLVIYDPVGTVPEYPSCKECGCTFNTTFSGRYWCAAAIYIACNNSCISDKSMNITNFNQRLIDNSVGSTIDYIQWNKSWPVAYSGYSYELKNKNYDNSLGSNWQMSCNSYGTPGNDPISNCTSTCAQDQCRLQGDSGATCSGNKCSCSNGYYSPSGISCYAIPPPGACYAYWISNGTIKYVEFIWNKPSTTVSVNYSLSYYTNQNSYDTVITTSRIKDVYDYQYSRGAGAIAGKVSTLIGSSKSTEVACTPVTQSPTNVPTPAPTLKPTPHPTGRPTFGPTYDNPRVYISGDICKDDRCSCNGASWTCEGPPIYKEFAATTSDDTYISVRKWPSDFPYYLTVYWNISAQGNFSNTTILNSNNSNSNRRMLIKDYSYMNSKGQRKLLDAFIATDDMMTTDMNEYTSISPLNGVLYFNDSFEEKIAILIKQATIAVEGWEYFILNLMNCSAINNQPCTLVYPSQLFIVVQNSNGDSFNNNTSETEQPWWLWWVIGALIIFLMILAWLVYRYWWKHKQTHEQLQETEKELDDQIEQNELGFGNDLQQGDVGFNPLATGVPNSSKAPDTFGNEIESRKKANLNNNADVHVEKFQHREEFGQAKPGGRGGNDLQQPLLGNGYQ